jgi:hypothetical protein
LNDAMANLGRALAIRRAQHQAQKEQEKSDLTMVVYCRQYPSSSLTLTGGKQVTCEKFDNYTVSYCTVNAKTALCKDVAKLSLAPIAAKTQKAQPVAQSQDVAQPQVQPTVQPEPAVPPQPQTPHAAVQQPAETLTVAPPQPSPKLQPQTQMVSASAAPATEEISVAEAARRNKAARQAARKANENQQAQTEAPAPPQQ